MIIAVTGNIAAGKSSVMDILKKMDAEIISADYVYHKLIKKGQSLHGKLIEEFGESIIFPDGEIDRKALGNIVFSDKAKLERLNSITHPAIMKEIKRLSERSEHKKVVIEIPLLLEKGHEYMADEIWYVDAPRDIRLMRLIQRNNISKDEAQKRMDSQLRDGSKRCDITISNDSTLSDLEQKIKTLWNRSGDIDMKMELTDDNYCFACGRDNPIGLKLELQPDGDTMVCEFTAEKKYQGYCGIMHGGISSVILDEIMARLLIDIKKIVAVTLKMEVKFRKPVKTGETVIARAFYESSEKNFHFVRGEIRSSDGKLLVSSKGTYAEL